MAAPGLPAEPPRSRLPVASDLRRVSFEAVRPADAELEGAVAAAVELEHGMAIRGSGDAHAGPPIADAPGKPEQWAVLGVGVSPASYAGCLTLVGGVPWKPPCSEPSKGISM